VIATAADNFGVEGMEREREKRPLYAHSEHGSRPSSSQCTPLGELASITWHRPSTPSSTGTSSVDHPKSSKNNCWVPRWLHPTLLSLFLQACPFL